MKKYKLWVGYGVAKPVWETDSRRAALFWAWLYQLWLRPKWPSHVGAADDQDNWVVHYPQ